jgi:hypothetical protein
VVRVEYYFVDFGRERERCEDVKGEVLSRKANAKMPANGERM